jgi:pimeloyl-ACP methyl ester carboxylesterase
VTSNSSSRAFRNGPLEFAVREFGPRHSDPTIVLLHGFPQSTQTYETVAAGLADRGHRVLVPELRGDTVACRPDRAKDYAIRHVVSDIRALLDQWTIRRVHLVGHDFGGIATWSVLAAEFPEVASATVLSTPHPRGFLAGGVVGTQGIKSAYMTLALIPGVDRVLLADNARLMRKVLRGLGLDSSWIDVYTAQYAKDPQRLRAGLNWYLGMLHSGQYWRIGTIGRPVDLIAGIQDPVVSRRSSLKSLPYLTDAGGSVTVLDDAGHWLPEMHHQAVIDHISARLHRS